MGSLTFPTGAWAPVPSAETQAESPLRFGSDSRTMSFAGITPTMGTFVGASLTSWFGDDEFFDLYKYELKHVPEVGEMPFPVQTDYRFAILITQNRLTDKLKALLDKRGVKAKIQKNDPLKGGDSVGLACTVLHHYPNFRDQVEPYPVYGESKDPYWEIIYSVVAETPSNREGQVYHPIAKVVVTTQRAHDVGLPLNVPKQIFPEDSIAMTLTDDSVQISSTDPEGNPHFEMDWEGSALGVDWPFNAFNSRQTFVNERLNPSADQDPLHYVEYDSEYEGVQMGVFYGDDFAKIHDPEVAALFGNDGVIDFGVVVFGGAKSVFGDDIDSAKK